ncbi:hypothetical protein SAMN05216576_107185 [Ectopseudomonas chengduensis]|jgi:hypothetical protein|uniref:Uncharacterized protein n=1 Tax=Ectopseudomonas chengduensis TaxID=489632 RepID=A0A1G6Q092_9GAMM|nr:MULTISPECIES: hypothetical protein [Pseudomonas]MBP3062015.1 hypothetical protein [Pseudomonas chengduensis]NNB75309.1 hypothetical protein [Pseudomonas chengduensis]OEO24450.1 hypothetical protein AX279_17425 [Pseudomonas sp. J237]SDC85739.1 hypothetical protein SAMN05216576_107185 [Pseudomonas chengduensis]
MQIEQQLQQLGYRVISGRSRMIVDLEIGGSTIAIDQHSKTHEITLRDGKIAIAPAPGMHALATITITTDQPQTDAERSHRLTLPIPEPCSERYASGWAYADWHLANGGNTEADAPGEWHEEKVNGFWDRLTEERQRLSTRVTANAHPR